MENSKITREFFRVVHQRANFEVFMDTLEVSARLAMSNHGGIEVGPSEKLVKVTITIEDAKEPTFDSLPKIP